MADKLVKCPFNPSHVLTEDSLQRHIIRCMVNYPSYVICPYNALHRFKNKDLLCDHMLECESREKNILFYESSEVKPLETCIHIQGIRDFNLAEENWDEE
ncbi:gametocyte-specific factor 1 homolog [Anoplophora glabripennis]|uniref:gametocyte-specific factor 1 homolog n=1 Tax=Anoplophora glabripennis TaxID=217634 RepID=UPI000874D405|nr:gametocyte-specific factor 1 homolog [Anoplophora glabripennis]